MSAAWDRTSTGYREDWLPRLAPFHHDLVAEMAIKSGHVVKATPDLEPFVVRAGGDPHGRAPFDAIVSTASAIEPGWSDELGPHGKVGVLFWGPADADDPVLLLERVVAGVDGKPSWDRAAIGEQLHANGLALVRHTILHHTLLFQRAEELATRVVRGCTWKGEFEARGPGACAKALAKFYDQVGGPDRPVSWVLAATVVIAGLPGSEIELPHRPSVKIPL